MGGYHNDWYHYRDDCERCAGAVRIRTDNRLRGWHEASLPHYAEPLYHRRPHVRLQEDRARRLAAQGLPQVLRGGVGEGQTGAETCARPDVLLQAELKLPCRRITADCRGQPPSQPAAHESAPFLLTY